MSGRPEHDGIAGGPATVGVRGRVGRALIGLDLGEANGYPTVPQHCAEQRRRDLSHRRSQVPAPAPTSPVWLLLASLARTHMSSLPGSAFSARCGPDCNTCTVPA